MYSIPLLLSMSDSLRIECLDELGCVAEVRERHIVERGIGGVAADEQQRRREHVGHTRRRFKRAYKGIGETLRHFK